MRTGKGAAAAPESAAPVYTVRAWCPFRGNKNNYNKNKNNIGFRTDLKM